MPTDLPSKNDDTNTSKDLLVVAAFALSPIAVLLLIFLTATRYACLWDLPASHFRTPSQPVLARPHKAVSCNMGMANAFNRFEMTIEDVLGVAD
jgi:hypothetical protein